MIVAGARPNFMKVAPILRALGRGDAPWRPVLVHTGQHYDAHMSDVFFRDLGIREPDVHLGVGSGRHGEQTARILTEFEALLCATEPRPAGVVVVGDVNSTVACALAAVKLGIPVAHVEAGLRSFDRAMPEEINRVVTDHIADLLLVSEPAGEDNLAREGIAAERVHYVGNVMIDSLVAELSRARALDMPAKLGIAPGGYVAVTLHRPSNVDHGDRLAALIDLILEVAASATVVFPIHPRTRQALSTFGLTDRLSGARGVIACEPMGYREILGVMAEAALVITDSGGVQEETTYLGVPCLTLRPNTERPVTTTHGTNVVTGDDLSRARDLALATLAGKRPMTSRTIRGWDGHAAGRIADHLIATWA